MPRRIPARSYELSTYKKLSLLLNALTSMVALAVAYPMSGEMMGHSSVAKREEVARRVYLPYGQTIRAEDEADGVYFPLHYDDTERRAEDEAAGVYFPLHYDDTERRAEDEAAGVYFPLHYDDTERRSEDEAAGVYFPLHYDDTERRSEDEALGL